MSKAKSFDIDWAYYSEEVGDVTVQASGCIHPGCSACFYLKNGDPGYPAEPEEVEFDEVVCFDSDGNSVEFDESQYDDLESYVLENAPEDYDRYDDYQDDMD